jgi:hypothetical protein
MDPLHKAILDGLQAIVESTEDVVKQIKEKLGESSMGLGDGFGLPTPDPDIPSDPLDVPLGPIPPEEDLSEPPPSPEEDSSGFGGILDEEPAVEVDEEPEEEKDILAEEPKEENVSILDEE